MLPEKRNHELLLRLFLVLLALTWVGCLGESTSSPSKASRLASPPGFQQFADHIYFKTFSPLEIGERSTSFTALDSTVTGVDFTNYLSTENHLKLVENGSGVAIADYDGDGLADIYLLSTDGPNQLYRQISYFRFENVTQAAHVDGSVDQKDAWGAGAAFADVDNDGDLDLYVCNMAARNLLYINQGDGTFVEQAENAGVDFVGASRIGSFCDYDADGDLDFYLLTYQDSELERKAKLRIVNGEPTVHPDYVGEYTVIGGHVVSAGDPDVLYRNNGDGTFTDVSASSGIEGFDMGLSVTWWDFNSDNRPDIYIGNDFKFPDHLYRNNGDGTFTDVLKDVVSHTPWFSMGADAGDLNNDGMVDLMIADMSGSTHYKQKTNMGDMSDSGWFLTFGNPRQYMRNAVYVNTGTGRFMEAAYLTGLDSTDWTWSVRFADLDNDGLQDVFITNGNARNTGDSDFKARFEKLQAELPKEELDVILSNTPPLLEKNVAFRNLGGLEFEPVGDKWNIDLNGVSHGAAFADFDHDGDLDIVVNNLNERATIYRNDSREGNRVRVQLRGVKNNRFGYGATVEVWHGVTHQTKQLFPTRGYISSDEPDLHFGLGESDNIERLVVTWPTGNQQEFTNLKPGRMYQIIEAKGSASIALRKKPAAQPVFERVDKKIGLKYNHTEIDFNNFRREPLLPYQLSEFGPGVSVGDINADGWPDVYIGGANLNSGKLYFNDRGNFKSARGPWSDDMQSEDMASLFFDANGDGADDLYVVSGSNEFEIGSKLYRDRLYLNDGSGRFARAPEETLPELYDSGSCVCAADFDRDGDLDLFVGSRSIPGKYPLTPESRLLRNDGGKFTLATTDAAPGLEDVGLVNAALWTDFDNDGWIDLLVALDWGPITVFKNNDGQLENVTGKLGLEETLGWWHGLASGDFDRDGDMDYVATNQGLNTKYHCSPDHPHRLYYSDFDNSGTLDLVEAEFEGDTEFPVRGRSCSSRCMPFIAEKFDTFHEFAMAPLEDIYTPEIKNRPYREVNELRSMVIWNEGDKGMRMEPLPRLAQISPSFGVQTGDFDGDGHLDILLAQNFFGSQPETGYMDGGLSLLLRGNGEGSFTPVWPRESGIVVPGDATAVTVADIDRDFDLDCIIATNNGPIHAYQNSSGRNDDSRRIRLATSDPAQTAIGATVLVNYSTGEKQLFEINAGSGYLGQAFSEVLVSGDVKSLTVRWPDGTTSNHNIDQAESELLISNP